MLRTAFVRGLRQLRLDARRHLLPAFALTCGVALLFGTLVSSSGVQQRLAEGADSLGGLGEVGVVPRLPGGLLSEAEVAAVADLPGVATAVSTYSESTTIRSVGVPVARSERDITVTGYPTDLNSTLLALPSSGRLPAPGTAEVAVPDDIADDLGLEPGDQLEVATTTGTVRWSVVGILPSADLGVLAVDNVFVDIDTARTAFAAPDAATRVDLILASDVSVGDWTAAATPSLPSGVRVQDTSALRTSFEPLLDAVTVVLVATSLVTLGVSTMLGSLAFASAVDARGATYATMRAVGASRGWLARIVLAEALVIGSICVGLGLVAGLGVAAVLTRVLAAAGSLPVATAGIDIGSLVVAGAVGLVAAVAGSLVAILQVVRQPPTHGLRGTAVRHRRWRPAVVTVAGGLVAGGILVLLAGRSELALAGVAALLVGAAMLAPTALVGLAFVVRPRSWTGRVAAVRLRTHQALGPVTGLTTLVVALSAALIVSVAAIDTAMRTQLARQFGADVQVSSPVPDARVTASIEADDNVAAVSGTAFGEARLVIGDPRDTTAAERDEGTAVTVLAVDPDTYFDTAQLPWREGDDVSTPAALSAGGTVVLPAALAQSQGLVLGDTVTLEAATAARQLEVVGTYASLVTGTQVVVDRETGGTLGVTAVTDWNVRAEEGVAPQELRDELAAALSGVPGVSVITAADLLERASSELAVYVTAVAAIVVLALTIGATGAGGVFALEIARRRRELGVLRAVGATPGAMRRLVAWEAALVAVAAVIVGLVVGQLAGALLTTVIAEALGATLVPSFQPLALIGVAVVTAAALQVAALAPGARAVRLQPVATLRTE